MNMFKSNRKIFNIFNNNYVWYIILAIFVIVSCMYFDKDITNRIKAGIINQINISVPDYYINIFSGEAILNKYGKRDYDIPFMWMSVQLIVCAVISLKPFYCSSYKDVYKLIQSRSRTNYIIRQIYDILIKIVSVYAVIMAVIVLYSFGKGNINIDIHYELFDSMNNGAGIGIYIYPFIYSIMMALLQLLLNMYMNRVIAIALIIACNITAIYIPVWYTLGNISMIYRSSNLGTDVRYSVIACVILIIMFVILSIYRFNKYDVICTKEPES